MDRIGIGIGMDPVMGPGLGSGWNGVGTLMRIGLDLDAYRI